MVSKKFKKLERHVENEYLKKGFGKKRALYIGKAVAGQQALKRRKALA